MEVIINNNEIDLLVKEELTKCVQGSFSEHRERIRESVREMFKKGIFDKECKFENQIHWSIENALNHAMTDIVEEIDLKGIMKDEVLKLIKDTDLMRDLALEKVRSSFNLK